LPTGSVTTTGLVLLDVVSQVDASGVRRIKRMRAADNPVIMRRRRILPGFCRSQALGATVISSGGFSKLERSDPALNLNGRC